MKDFPIIDAHVHLWKKQQGTVNGSSVFGIGGGKSNFGGEIRQMLPPYMDDDKNTVERLLANMDYAGVNGAVVTQEYIDGDQDSYLKQSKAKYPDRIRICSLYEEKPDFCIDSVDGVKICAGRLKNKDLKQLMPVFKKIENAGKFVSIDLAEGEEQVSDMEYLINSNQNLRIAIGHFGMVSKKGWQKQIELATHDNVYIESGGLTWLFHKEFYPYPSAVEAIIEAKNICGINKLMWGSDYPRTMTDITYIMAVKFIKENTKLPNSEKSAFLGENAVRFYRFDTITEIKKIENML